jgi:DNA polymerase-3 subunit alpha
MLSFHREAASGAGQDSLFGSLAAPVFTMTLGQQVSLTEKLAWEKELLGIYVSGHPLDAHTNITEKSKLSISAIKLDPKKGQPIILPVLVADVRIILTKGGEKMAFVKFEDKTDSIEAVIFPKLFKEHGAKVQPGACLLIKGNVSDRNGEISLALENLKAL